MIYVFAEFKKWTWFRQTFYPNVTHEVICHVRVYFISQNIYSVFSFIDLYISIFKTFATVCNKFTLAKKCRFTVRNYFEDLMLYFLHITDWVSSLTLYWFGGVPRSCPRLVKILHLLAIVQPHGNRKFPSICLVGYVGANVYFLLINVCFAST